MTRWLTTIFVMWAASTVASANSGGLSDKEGSLQLARALERSLISDEMLSKLPVWLRPFCVWKEATEAEPTEVDPTDLHNAVANSVAWIRAVLKEEYVPPEIEEQIVGVVNDVEGADATRLAFSRPKFRFLVTQTAYMIVIVVQPLDEDHGARGASLEELEAYMARTISDVLKHSPAILCISKRVKKTSFGAEIWPLELPSAEDDREEHERAHRRLAEEVCKADPTLPRNLLRAGLLSFWWRRVYGATDGHIVVIKAGKGDGGKMVFVPLKDWFRKDKLPGRRSNPWVPLPRNDAPPATITEP